MKKILGLDLGVSSIGWAYITEDEKQPGEILGMGVRIVPLSPDERDEFTAGNAISKNMKRRIKRGMRRNLMRRTMRKDLLRTALKKAGMLPDKELFSEENRDALWQLRSNAASEKVSLEQLGRVLYHINQKRGFKSNRKTDGAEADAKKESEYKAEIRKNSDLLKTMNITIGEYMYKELTSNPHFKLKGRIFPREDYIAEFDCIWAQQAKHHPNLTNELRVKLRDGIIFHQRPLKSQKALVNRCAFVKNLIIDKKSGKQYESAPRVAPKSSPIAQLCRILEMVNNIKFKDRLNKDVNPDVEQRNALVQYLLQHPNASKTTILKVMGIDKKLKNTLAEKVHGDNTYSQISEILARYDASELLAKIHNWPPQIDDVQDNDDPAATSRELTRKCVNHPYYRIWHTIYSIEQDDSGVRKLQSEFGVSAECAADLMKLDFSKAGFSNKSAKAMRKIIPFLMEGYKYSDAMLMAGFKHSESLNKEELDNRVLQDRLKLIDKGELRQPVVEKILNQLVNLTNAIMDDPKYGKPDEIRIELARELQQSMDERKSATKSNKDAEKRNEDITQILKKEYGFTSVSRNLINKYKLYDQMGGISPYTGKRLNMADFLNGSGVDVEHIIPRSKYFDDSLTNKTLAESWVNKKKGNMTAYSFMEQQPVEGLQSFEDYIQFINDLRDKKIIGGRKFGYLMCPDNEIPTDFIERQLRQTQYITRMAMQMLRGVVRTVSATSGGVTDFLREKWGYNDVLKRVNWERYEKMGLAYESKDSSGKKKYQIEGWTKRDDHRHHAIDALVIACTKPTYVQSLNNLSQRIEAPSEGKSTALKNMDHYKLSEIEKLCPFEVGKVIQIAKAIVVSYKAGKRVASLSRNKATGHKHLIPRGPLSEETVYGRIKQRIKVSVALSKTFDPAHEVVDKNLRKVIADRLKEFNGNSEKAFSKKLYYPGTEEVVKKVDVWQWQEEVVVKYPITSLKQKDLEFIVDGAARQRIAEFYARCANEKDFIKRLGTETIWLNQDKGIAIKSVRLKTGLGKVVPVKEVDGDTSAAFVKPGNNHHLAIYERADGSLFDHMVSFQEAFAARKAGLPVYQIEREDGILKWKFEQNALFELNDPVAGRNIYRVQKVAKSSTGSIAVMFRLNTITSTEESWKMDYRTISSKELINSGIFYIVQSIVAITSLNPIACKLNLLGKRVD